MYNVTLIVAAPAAPPPSITSFKIGHPTTSTAYTIISSSNGVDYYYTNTILDKLWIEINTSNTSNFSINKTTGPSYIEVMDVWGYTQGTNGVYKYDLQGTDMGSGVFTISLTNNGVNKIYYLHTTGFSSY